MQKFYFHNSDSGILFNGVNALLMDDTIGTLQVSINKATFAETSPQLVQFASFLSPPLAAQTIPAGDWTVQGAFSESNNNVNFLPWNFSSVSVYHSEISISSIIDTIATGTESSTSETVSGPLAGTSTGSTNVLNGERIIFQCGARFSQSMSTVYNVTMYFDGTTEGSATSNAAYVLSPVDLTLYSAGAPANRPEQTVGGMRQAVHRAASRCWTGRKSGILVPKLWVPEGATI